MRILYSLNSIGPGGVQSLVFDLCEHFAKLGIDVGIISFSPISSPFQVQEYIRLKKLFPIYLPERQLINKIDRLSYVCKITDMFRPNIVHCHTPMPHFYLLIASKRLNIKIIATFHNLIMWPNILDELKAKIMFLSCLSKLTDFYIAICNKIKDMMINKYFISPKKIKLIYNGVNEERLKCELKSRNEIRAKIGISENDLAIVHIAKVEFMRKNQLLSLRVHRALKHYYKAFLLFVGDGPDLNILRDMNKDDPTVKILGARKDIPELLASSDIFFLPSYREGFPISIIEAMYYGLPVIASNVGGISEIIKDGINGFLIDPNNYELERLVSLIIQLRDKREIYNKVSENAINTAKLFGIEKCAKEHLSLYKEII